MDKERTKRIMEQLKAKDEITAEQAIYRAKVLQDKLNDVHDYFMDNEEWLAAMQISVIAGMKFMDVNVVQFMTGSREACSEMLTELAKEVKNA